MILDARARGGNLVVPTFALERTQELLLDIATLSSSGCIGNATVFVDSPLTPDADVTLPDAAANHVGRVLRLRAGAAGLAQDAGDVARLVRVLQGLGVGHLARQACALYV